MNFLTIYEYSTMNIEIDGISVKTNSFILEYKDGDNQTCGSVIVNYFPSEAVFFLCNNIKTNIY